jgi:AcrR family transcriptional regulator
MPIVMARRSDHSRAELETMIVLEGHRQMEEIGFARFSAREVAKRIGYSIGTLYNVFGSHDRLILAINARTLRLWTLYLHQRLAECGGGDRIRCLVQSYFDFAQEHAHAWAAIYDHRLAEDQPLPEDYAEAMAGLTAIVTAEVAAILPDGRRGDAPALAASLLAVVHGHCDLAMTGTLRLLGATAPADAALMRVRESLAAAGAQLGDAA